MKVKYVLYLVLIPCCMQLSCKKYLDAKSNKSLVVPKQVQDLQALLDNNTIMNRASPSDGEGSADNYYLTYDDWQSLDPAYRNIYIWGDEIVYDEFPNDWGQSYDQVYFANTCLEQIKNIERNATNAVAWDNVKGSALFFRANAFLKLVITWANVYDSITANTDLGIPLRLTSDFNQPSIRASVKDSYAQIIADLQQAVPLLPSTQTYLTRPSKAAVYGLLSRTYMAMAAYDKAGAYADSCLQLYNTLLDYNMLDKHSTYPIPAFNNEMLFYMSAYGYELADNIARVDTVLLSYYDNNDLRKALFFNYKSKGTFFRGGYNGDYTLFTGIATDEMYLNRAEYFARARNTTAALRDLNTLLKNRWKNGTYTNLNSDDAEKVLQWVLQERRKELLFRDLRWMDLKRLNKEERFETAIKRKLNGIEYQLPPNDPWYALPIPASVIQLSGIVQNPR